MPVGTGKTDTANIQVGENKVVPQGSHINDSIVGEPSMVAVQAEVPSMDRMELEAFMNEKLKILVHEPQAENEPLVVETEVGGTPCYILRGRPQMVRRKYVEALARARNPNIRHWYKQQGETAKNFQSFSSRALTYPFNVEVDPSGGKGAAWLAAILSTAG